MELFTVTLGEVNLVRYAYGFHPRGRLRLPHARTARPLKTQALAAQEDWP